MNHVVNQASILAGEINWEVDAAALWRYLLLSVSFHYSRPMW